MTQRIKTVILGLAGFTIKVNLFPTEWAYSRNKFTSEFLEYYSPFILIKKNCRIDFTIDVTEQRNLKFYMEKMIGFLGLFEEKNEKYLITYYQLSRIQFQLLINNALHLMLESNDGFVLHASANNSPDGALIFLGPSGQGKSTIMKLLNGTYPALADDSVIIRKVHTKYYVFQTPTTEKESWIKKSPKRFPLKDVYILGRKSSEFALRKLEDKSQLFAMITTQVISNINNSKKLAHSVLGLLENRDCFYLLTFKKSKDKLLRLLKGSSAALSKESQ